MRNRPNYSPAQYSVEWANIVTSYLKKLLAEIALPSAARPGLNIKQTFKGVLNDPETRDKWVSKFSYWLVSRGAASLYFLTHLVSLDLLREFYAESLVDHGTFLPWIAQQMATSNLAQACFVARIADEYLEGMLPYRGLQRALIEGCLAKHSEVQRRLVSYPDPNERLDIQIQSTFGTSGGHHLAALATALSSLLQVRHAWYLMILPGAQLNSFSENFHLQSRFFCQSQELDPPRLDNYADPERPADCWSDI